MKIGVQLWGALRGADTDPMSVLRELAAMGYRRIEPCVSPEEIPGMEKTVWSVGRLEAMAGEIASLGLEIVSCHLFAENIAACGDALRRLTALGVRQFVVKSPPELTDEALRCAALRYMRASDLLAQDGAELLIHNEAADITAHFGTKTAFEHLLDLCLGKVGAQVDVGWAYYAGEDPEALLWRNAGRVKSLHFKDFAADGDGLREISVGAGAVDTAACFQFCRAFGCTQVVDMDEHPISPAADYRASRQTLARLADYRADTVSYLNTLDVDTGEVRTLRRFPGVIEAPNWLKGRNRILYNAEGRMYAFDPDTGDVRALDTGECVNCNNDHVVSPDEKHLAVSHMTFDGGFTSRIYVLPIDGGEPRLVTPGTPSFLHGWSPDGGELAYCAFREHNGKQEVDVYTIPADGGEERRLTSGGFNDGPEYSPDGQYIWFNSTRSGLMQLWRMRRDGGEPTQMTFSERNNWFGHVSPDGRRVVFLSYGKDDLESAEHLPNMQVELRIMNADGSGERTLLSLFGGQGTMNVNSWAGDSRYIAFVSYELRHK